MCLSTNPRIITITLNIIKTMTNQNELYEAPAVTIVEVKQNGVICASAGSNAVLFSAMGHPFQQFAEMISRSSVTSGSSLVWSRTDLRLLS